MILKFRTREQRARFAASPIAQHVIDNPLTQKGLQQEVFSASCQLMESIGSTNDAVKSNAMLRMEKCLVDVRYYQDMDIELYNSFCPKWYKDKLFWASIILGPIAGMVSLWGLLSLMKYFMIGGF